MIAQVYNTNVLIERGIDPHILNLAVTTFTQNIAYKATVERNECWANNCMKEHYKLIYDPFNSYGIDIKLEIPLTQEDHYNMSNTKEQLDALMGLQSYLQSERLYETKSLSLFQVNKDHEIIRFRFLKEAIPREIKYYRSLEGFLHVKEGILDKIIIKNSSPFNHLGIKINSYQKTLYFSPPAQGSGYLIKEIDEEIEGTKDNELYKASTVSKIDYYWNKEEHKIELLHKNISKHLDANVSYTTVNIDLDRTFPLLGQEVRKAGYDLPKPFGVSLISIYQTDKMRMTDFSVNGFNGEKVDLNEYVGGDSKYENITYATLIRTDIWLLPFLNFGLLLGGADTSTVVTLQSPNGIPNPLYIPGLTPEYIVNPGSEATFDPLLTKSLLYGVGTTLAGGIGNYFATIDIQYLTSYTASADVSINMLVATPLFGYYFQDYGVRVFGGGQYQDLEKTITFDVSIPNTDDRISGEIGLESEKWAGLLGADYSFTRHWNGNMMLTYGEDRQNVILSLGYRW